MIDSTERLIALIRERAVNPDTQTDMPNPRALPETATAQTLEITKTQLGFALPALLKNLYLEIANGGFGPGYGLIGIDGGARDDRGFITDLHTADNETTRTKRHPNWPENAIRICNWGCGLYSILDCANLETFLFNPDADETEFPNRLIPHHKTLPEFWMAWVNGKNLLDEAFESNKS